MAPSKGWNYNTISDFDDGDEDPSCRGDREIVALPSSASKAANGLIVTEDNSINTITVDDAIERLGMGRFQIQVLVAAGLCFASDAMQVLLLSFLCVVLKVDWHLSGDQSAAITSFLFAGAVIGTLILGPYADTKGRKPAFLVAATIITVFGMAASLAQTYVTIVVIYFMVGFGVGGLTVAFDVLAEFLPAASRGKNLLLIEYFWTAGVLLVVGFAYMTLGSERADNWRLFVFLSSIPCCFSIILGWLYVPESPRWLVTQGRSDEALAIMRKAAKVNGHNPDEMFPPNMRLADEEKEESNFAILFEPQWIWTILKLWGAWALFAFGYYGTIMAITSIFASESSTDDDDGTTRRMLKEYAEFDYGAIFVSSSAEFVGTTFAILLVERVGRIPLQVVSYSVAGVSLCCLCILADQEYHRNVLIAFGFMAKAFEMSGSCVTWVSTAELLTTEVRTTGHSTANAMARIGALLAPFLIESDISLTQMGYIMLAIHACTVIFVSVLPETAGVEIGTAVTDDAAEPILADNSYEGQQSSGASSLDLN